MSDSQEITNEILSMVFKLLDKSVYPIFFLIILYIYRESISALISRITGICFQHGDTSGEIKADHHVELITKTDKLSEKEAPSEDGDKIEEDTDNDNLSQQWYLSMFDALVKEDIELAENIFSEHIKLETDEDIIARETALYYASLYIKANDKSALKKLDDLIKVSKDDHHKSHALYWLSFCHTKSKNYTEAKELWILAIKSAKDEKEKTNFINNLSQVYRKNNEADKALEILLARMKEVEDKDDTLSLYRSISAVEKDLGNKINEALALEKTIELDPDNEDTLFNAAYAQSNADLRYLAMTNYDTLLKLDPDNDTAENNLGVEFENIDLNMMASTKYKESANKNNTLAMANLAKRYYTNGFKDEAKEQIDKALKQEDPHKDVYKVSTLIEDEIEREKAVWDDTLIEADKFREFMRKYTSAYYNEYNSDFTFCGKWINEENDIIEIEAISDNIKATWNKSNKKITMSGKYLNSSADIEYREEDIKDEKSGLVNSLMAYGMNNSRKHNCFAYISRDNKNIFIMEKNKTKPFSLRLTRS